MSSTAWITEETPLDRPNTARMYDYVLGGYHNFEADRQMAEKVMEITPFMRLTAQINRGFLRRAVRYLTDQGIDQFLDIGSGIPTAGNVHEIAQASNPAARVVYVDIDPVAVAHSKAMLRDNPLVTAIRADVCVPVDILTHPDVTGLLDFGRPLGLLLVAVLHYVPDDDQANAAVARFREILVPGSFLVIAHGIPEIQPPDVERRLVETFHRFSSSKQRTAEQIMRFFEGLELVEPGLVLTPLWHPEGPDDVGLDRPELSLSLVGVGRKP
jgi:SAM-dependent methyltransferase